MALKPFEAALDAFIDFESSKAGTNIFFVFIPYLSIKKYPFKKIQKL